MRLYYNKLIKNFKYFSYEKNKNKNTKTNKTKPITTNNNISSTNLKSHLWQNKKGIDILSL